MRVCTSRGYADFCKKDLVLSQNGVIHVMSHQFRSDINGGQVSENEGLAPGGPSSAHEADFTVVNLRCQPLLLHDLPSIS